jgi:PAS domain-containing protein
MLMAHDLMTERLATVRDHAAVLVTLFEHAPVGVQIVRADGESLLVNQAYRDLFSSTRPAGDNLWSENSAVAEAVRPFLRRALAGETVPIPANWYVRELQHGKAFSSDRVAVEAVAIPLGTAGGAVSHVALMFKDLTAERLRAEEKARSDDALREHDASFRVLFADNPLPMWVYDVGSLRFLEVNDAAVRHYGYSRDEFLAMRIVDI